MFFFACARGLHCVKTNNFLEIIPTPPIGSSQVSRMIFENLCSNCKKCGKSRLWHSCDSPPSLLFQTGIYGVLFKRMQCNFAYKIFDIYRYGNGKPLMPMAFYVMLHTQHFLNKISKLSVNGEQYSGSSFGNLLLSHINAYNSQALFYIIITLPTETIQLALFA